MYPKTLSNIINDNDCESIDLNKYGTQDLWRFSRDLEIVDRNINIEAEREYSFDEAIELAGSGWYTNGLLMVLSLSLLAMSIDVLSFPTVVALSSCDFYLTNKQTDVLLAIPYAGPVIMAFFWGYVSDTQGRWKSLLISMSVSFLMSLLCAFAPNWITLAIFKFIGTGLLLAYIEQRKNFHTRFDLKKLFTSSCAMSVSYVLLGECCCERLKSTYLFILASAMHVSMSIYFALAYAISNLKFEYNMGFIFFVPWRLLVVVLGLPLGFSAVGLIFFYESPKFLFNAGRKDQGLEVLGKVCLRNCGNNVFYPVQKVVLNEYGNIMQRSNTFLGSMWQQIAPLFRPPLLHRTILLYCLMFIIYSSSSSIRMWLTFFADDFTKAIISPGDDKRGLCSVIVRGENEGLSDQIECLSQTPFVVVTFSVSVGVIYSILNLVMSRFASRKKILMVIIFVISGACCIGTMHIPNNLIDIIMFFGSMAVILCTGNIFAYCVDIYPTSHRGMATSLCVLVAQISSVFGVKFIGSYVTWHCTSAFFALAGLIFCGAILSYLLPTDNIKKK